MAEIPGKDYDPRIGIQIGFMCGISALFSLSNEHGFSFIKDMNSPIKHRGPDDEGYALFSNTNDLIQIYGGESTPENVYSAPWPYCPRNPFSISSQLPWIGALGHRRLAIIDLSPAGHQPMCTPDKNVWITYNGEIYNHVELRNELQKLGHDFHSQSDTEVILHSYQEWGTACLERFNGMFAFVLYDRKHNKVFAARDRFGVKPLYYWLSPQGFIAFASEIKQLTTLPGWKAQLNGQCAYDFLNWGALDHTQETMFASVRQLRGGEMMEINLSAKEFHQIKAQKWYALEPRHFKGSFKQASEQFYDLLEDSIKIRLKADATVGSCLSGGLDSSSIVCVANKYQESQKTFSACSEIKRFDERYYIENIAKHTGVIAHYTYPCLEDLFQESKIISWHQDEPYISTSLYAQWLVFKSAKEKNIKVMLDGQGSDEQLAGYPGCFGNLFYDHFRSFRWRSLVREMWIAQQNHRSLRPISLLANKLLPHRIRHFLRKILGKPTENPSWLNQKLLKADGRDPFFSTDSHTTLAQSIQQLLHSSLPMLLHFEDRNSMAHSIESRTPFLDYRLVEFSLGLPTEFKLSNGISKRVLREGMQGILPEIVRNRIDKMSFETAEEVWIRSQASGQFLSAIDEAIDLSQGILRKEVRDIVQDIVAGKRPFSYLPWRIISFGQWLKLFNVHC